MNILLITADQWRGDCLSALGHPCLRTPALDRLAAGGVLFRNHYAQCVPCGPSRASLLTGMYLQNHRSGINGTPLDARFTNLALEARAAGYRPALFGYTDTSPDPRGLAPGDPRLRTYENPLPGFDHLLDTADYGGDWFDHLAELGYALPDNHLQIYRPADDADVVTRGPTWPPTRFPVEHSETTFVAERALDWLRDRDEKPWFLHLSFLRPHPPYRAPAPYHAMYDPADAPPPVRRESAEAEAAIHPWLAWCLKQGYHGYGADLGHTAQIRATYYGLMSQVDDQLARIFAALEASGQDAETLIVFTSDHGELAGDHWLLGKVGWFDATYHIPLIVRDPRREADPARGRVVDRFTESVDIMPTILDLLGRGIPRQCDGRSLRPFLENRTPEDWRRYVHFECDFRDPELHLAERALGLQGDDCLFNVIRDERGKYVHFRALPPLFFDLESDPGELTDRAGDPAMAQRVLDYAQAMLTWRMGNDERTLTHIKLAHDGPVSDPGERSGD
ncbi:alkaline phosphatase family protein [Oceanibacterium hippocampi]|uniref:Arylsulfatase n=1 Tax=Oceanibacterium hippocampi TaxID=745714 RepID=A0A1Y5SE43_9PROT|nr:alkaline phosphatase family protein [Oceanibacterium hippocampi]SLN38643.1 Arylsulfatase [Oceanibacterium hippocampi]